MIKKQADLGVFKQSSEIVQYEAPSPSHYVPDRQSRSSVHRVDLDFVNFKKGFVADTEGNRHGNTNPKS